MWRDPAPELPIVFVHIPKTAGVSVTEAFQNALGVENCKLFSPTITDADVAGWRFVSGHLVLSTVTQAAWRFTFLRDPAAQLVSHLRWLDHYNDAALEAETAHFSASLHEVIARVGRTDFTSSASLGRLFEWLPSESEARLVNVQCEVMARRFDRIVYRNSAELAEAAIGNLPGLEFVGLVEWIDSDMRALFRRLGLRTAPQLAHRNARSSRRSIDLSDPAIRAALLPHVDADMRLYRHVRRSRMPAGRLAAGTARWIGAGRRRPRPAR